MYLKLFRAIVSIVLIASITANARAVSINFKQLDTADGLPHPTVWKVISDHKGYLWTGTTSGLVKYNGYEFISFDFQEKVNGLIHALEKDNYDNIWIGTKLSGLVKFNQKSGIFTTGATAENGQIQSNEIRALKFSDLCNCLYIGTSKGFSRLDVLSGEIQQFDLRIDNAATEQLIFISTIFESSSGIIWIGTRGGLVRFDPRNNNFNLIKQINVRVNTIIENSNKDLIIGTTRGLFQFNPSLNKVSSFSRKLSDFNITSLAKDSENNFWVGTIYNGLHKIDNNKRISSFLFDKSVPTSIRDNMITDLIVDDSNTLWVGTFNSGLNKVSLNNFQFEAFNNLSIDCLPSSVIYAIEKNENDSILVATSGGLSEVNLEKLECINHTSKTNSPNPLLGDSVVSLLRDSKNNLWIGTSNGINIRRTGQQEFETLFGGKTPAYANDIYEDTKNNYYISSEQGIYYIPRSKSELIRLKSDDKELEDTRFIKTSETRDNQIIFSTNKGLLGLDSENKIVKLALLPSEFSNNPIDSIYIDKNENFWVGMDREALLVVNQKGKLLHKFASRESLRAINTFGSIMESDKGNIYISHQNGLDIVNPNNWGVTTFDGSDGLNNNVFVHGSKLKDSNNIMYFGGQKGMVRFKADSLSKNAHIPKTVFTHLIYENKRFDFNDNSKDFNLGKPISSTKEINLSYYDRDYGFEFAALDSADPIRNQYAYQMEGWDKDWIYTDANNRRAVYNKLPPGDYVFKVKGSNNHGVWSDEPATVNVHISTPPWATVWAYAIYALCLILAIYLFIQYRTKSLQTKSIALENSVKERTKQLAEEKTKVEKLLSKKNDEFANVSHEFRTPLTLILGPIEQLIKSNEHPNEKLGVIQRNGYRLLRMVDQLLNMESFRVRAITQKNVQSSHKTIRLIAEAFRDLAAEKRISLNILNLEKINLSMVPDALEKIVLNILSNAIKYSKTDDQISIETFRTPNNQLHIQVIDTGIGIEEEMLDRIFDRFHRILNKHSEQVTGAGIGLALVKELVEAHKGSIKVDSRLGEGTKIDIFIPIIGEKSEEILVRPNEEIVSMELMSIGKQLNQLVDDNNVTQADINAKTHVLIIEDNADMRNYIRECLAELYFVSVANNGKEGLDKATQNVPDLIISDVMMPEIDGFTLCRKLKTQEVTSHIPLILLTARSDRNSRLQGWKNQADEYLTKPFDTEELLLRIENILNIRKLLKQRFFDRIQKSKLDHPNEKEFGSNPCFQAEAVPSGENKTDIDKWEKQEQQFVDKFTKQLEDNIPNPDFRVEHVARKLAMSESQLYRKVKGILGITPADYLRTIRLEKALRLIEKGVPISNVALDVGFTSHSYFTRCFSAKYGFSPSKFHDYAL